MMLILRRALSRWLMTLVRRPRLKLLGQRLLAHTPRLRGLVLRLLYGAPLHSSAEPINAFDGRGERQQRFLDDLQRRWEAET